MQEKTKREKNNVAMVKAVLHVGLSFASIGLFENDQLLAHKQIYLPQEPLGNSLKKFWAEYGLPDKIYVNSRFLEKILDSKLGGSVAQIVTKGFETWPVLRQPAWPDHFSLQAKRQSPLASQDLIFGIKERVSADGKIFERLDVQELETINQKLKQLSVKRVCVNLLFSTAYPDHQNQVAQYFKEQGFEVFAYNRDSSSQDEMPAWRKNIINACLSGVFTEHKDDIKNSLGDHPSEILFMRSHGNAFHTSQDHITEGLFAWSNSLARHFRKEADQVLYLGLENWSFISTEKKSAYWASPWGRIEVPSPLSHRLKSQPTLELVPGFWGGINFSKSELGYEPGPMSFGRALKPTAYDLMRILFSFDLAQNNSQGDKKLHDHLNAMIKNIPELRDHSIEKLAKVFIGQLAFQIASEAQFKNFSINPPISKTVISGFFAPLLFPLIKEHWVSGELFLDDQAEKCELMASHSLSQQENV
jgi:N-methylhydantoinase A